MHSLAAFILAAFIVVFSCARGSLPFVCSRPKERVLQLLHHSVQSSSIINPPSYQRSPHNAAISLCTVYASCHPLSSHQQTAQLPIHLKTRTHVRHVTASFISELSLILYLCIQPTHTRHHTRAQSCSLHRLSTYGSTLCASTLCVDWSSGTCSKPCQTYHNTHIVSKHLDNDHNTQPNQRTSICQQQGTA